MNQERIFGATVLLLFSITSFVLRDLKRMLIKQEALLKSQEKYIKSMYGQIQKTKSVSKN